MKHLILATAITPVIPRFAIKAAVIVDLLAIMLKVVVQQRLLILP